VLRRLLEESGIDTRLVLTDPHRPTTTKERFLGLAAHRHAQQILRVDMNFASQSQANWRNAWLRPR